MYICSRYGKIINQNKNDNEQKKSNWRQNR